MEPIGRTESIRVRSATDTLARAQDALAEAAGRLVTSDQNSAVYDFGKPITWRLWGKWGLRPENRIPFRVRISVESDSQSSRVVLDFLAETGGYLVVVPGVAEVFDRAARSVAAKVSDALA
jgi:hypothetical protein